MDIAELVVVTYRSRVTAERELRAYATLAAGSSPQVRWTFVDNSEDAGDAAFLRDLLPPSSNVQLRTMSENPGFAVACNEVAFASRATWVVLLNPDLALTPTALGRLVEALKSTPTDVDALALSQQTGALRHEGIAFNRLGWFMDRPVDAPRLGGWRGLLYRAAGGAGALVGPSGGAGAYRADVYRELGGLHPSFFAWGEDADLALRLHLTGHRCQPLDLALPHLGGHSVQGGAGARRRAHLLVRNRVWLAARLYSWPQTAAFSAFLLAVLLGKVPSMVRAGTLGANLRGVLAGYRGFAAMRGSHSGPRLRLRRS